MKFGELTNIYWQNVDVSVYESLRSRGLNLISDDELRLELIRLFEVRYDTTQRQIDLRQDVFLHFLNEYVPKNFQAEIRSATPTDYEALLKDQYLLGYVSLRLSAYKEIVERNTQRTMEEIRGVITRIDIALAGLN